MLLMWAHWSLLCRPLFSWFQHLTISIASSPFAEWQKWDNCIQSISIVDQYAFCIEIPNCDMDAHLKSHTNVANAHRTHTPTGDFGVYVIRMRICDFTLQNKNKIFYWASFNHTPHPRSGHTESYVNALYTSTIYIKVYQIDIIFSLSPEWFIGVKSRNVSMVNVNRMDIWYTFALTFGSIKKT